MELIYSDKIFLKYWVDIVNDKGYVIYENCNLKTLDRFLIKAGNLLSISDIKEKSSSKKYIHGNEFIPFHTEQPEANFLIWYCIEQSDVGGESIIIDANSIINKFSRFEIEQLKKIKCNINISISEKTCHNILEEKNGKFYWYWVPWAHYDISETTEKLVNILNNSENITFKMKKNDIVILDNRRCFHARKHFKSPREIHRFLID